MPLQLVLGTQVVSEPALSGERVLQPVRELQGLPGDDVVRTDREHRHPDRPNHAESGRQAVDP